MSLQEKSGNLRSEQATNPFSYEPFVQHFSIFLEKWLYARESEKDCIFTSPLINHFGAPIVHLPQRADFHEYDVLTHMVLASWVVSYRIADIMRGYSQVMCDELKRSAPQYQQAAAIAAYLHDVEKTVESRKKYEPAHIGEKGESGNKVLLLNEKEQLRLGAGEGKQLKRALWRSLLMSDSNIFDYDVQDTLDIDTRTKVFEILCAYEVIDEAIIKLFKGKAYESTVSEVVQQLRLMSLDTKITTFAWGACVMSADNYAQGLPPSIKHDQESISALEATHARNNTLMQDIFNKLLQ